MKYCAINQEHPNEIMWSYTLEGIRDMIKLSGWGKWKIYELREVP